MSDPTHFKYRAVSGDILVLPAADHERWVDAGCVKVGEMTLQPGDHAPHQGAAPAEPELEATLEPKAETPKSTEAPALRRAH